MSKVSPILSFLRPGLPAMSIIAALAVSGCTSTSTIDTAFSDIEPAAGSAALPPPASPAVETAPAPAQVGAPRNTGTYPNINDEPPPASNHISDAERVELLAEMQALQAGIAAGRISPEASAARMAELERLAATHSDAVLRRIEAGE